MIYNIIKSQFANDNAKVGRLEFLIKNLTKWFRFVKAAI